MPSAERTCRRTPLLNFALDTAVENHPERLTAPPVDARNHIARLKTCSAGEAVFIHIRHDNALSLGDTQFAGVRGIDRPDMDAQRATAESG